MSSEKDSSNITNMTVLKLLLRCGVHSEVPFASHQILSPVILMMLTVVPLLIIKEKLSAYKFTRPLRTIRKETYLLSR